MLVFGGLLLGLEVAEAWSWLSVAGFALMTPVYAVQGTRRLRTRRRPTARADRRA
ncbi:hypothetical protein ACWEVY_26790 [Streptomyces longwoodensis]